MKSWGEGGFWGAFADGWLRVVAHLSGAGLFVLCDPGVGKGVGGGREEQLVCPSWTLILLCLFL